MKCLSAWLTVVAICAAPVSAGQLAKMPEEHLILKPIKPIVIDGKLDEWDMAGAPYVITAKGPKPLNRCWSSPSNPVKDDRDLSARASMCWDEQYLYVAGQVTDDHLIGIKPGSAGNQGPAGWMCDSLMLAVVSYRQPLIPNSTHSTKVFLALRYAVPGSAARGRFIKETARRELDRRDSYWKLTRHAKWASTETPRGYNVEAAIPWKDLGFVARPGERLYMAFMAADTDPDEPLNQVGWGYTEEPKDYPVFRLADRDDVLGLLTVSVDEVAAGRSWAARAELDARRGPARMASLRVVAADGQAVWQKPVKLSVPAGMTGHTIVECKAGTVAKPGRYTVELLGGPTGKPPIVVAQAPLRVLQPVPAPPRVQAPAGQLRRFPPERVYVHAFAEHHPRLAGYYRHGFFKGKQDYVPFLRKHVEPNLKKHAKYNGYMGAVRCLAMHAITGDKDYVQIAREIVDKGMSNLSKNLYYFDFQNITLYRYLTWLKDPESPFAPRDAEKRYRRMLHKWAANPPALMLSESGTHNRIWLRYSLLRVSRMAAEQDGKPVHAKVIEYTDHHKKLLGDVGDSDDAAAGYHWVAFRFAAPIYFYTGDLAAFATHKGWRRTMDRYVEMVGPGGACPQFGNCGGWPAIGDAVWGFELMSRFSRDGRFRWASHRIAEYVYNHMDYRAEQYHATCQGLYQNFALGYLFADDTVKPRPAPSHSRATWRHPIRPVSLQEAQNRPGLGRHVMDASRWIPDKAVLASNPKAQGYVDVGQAQGFWGLVDLLPEGGHAGQTPGNLITLMVHDAALLAGQDYHSVGPEHQNVVWIEDLDGVAQDPRPMTTEVPVFVDDPAFTFLRVRTTAYQHLPVVYTRDIFFAKAGYAVVKDRVRFETTMKVRLGPGFHTRCLGPKCGPNWFNTYYDYLYVSGLYNNGAQATRNPAWDLLIAFSPRPDRRHAVVDRYADNPCRCSPVQVRQTWSGLARPGQEVVFTTVLLPHAPVFKPDEWLNPPPDSNEPKRLDIVVDRDDLTVVRVITEMDPWRKFRHENWVMLNDTGKPAKAGPLESDGRIVVVAHHRDGTIRHRVVAGGKTLRYRGNDESAKARKLEVGPLRMPKELSR